MIEHPILDIKLSLKDILTMILFFFILIILVFLLLGFIFEKYFIKPINDLINEISTHKTYQDLKI